ncbi:MAG TPA: hypothetical protein VGG33_13545, partial [Polyangia bacterium]
MASAPAPATLSVAERAPPSASTPRALRVWAVSDAIYGSLIAVLAVVALPWKSPGFNLAFLAYAALLVGGAPFLYRGQRWTYQLALVTCLLGLVAPIAIAAGLVASWAYLRSAYGAFGAGAALGALLIAGVVIEVLALYPALRLHGLLRREVRAGLRVGRGPFIAAAILMLLPLPVGLAIHLRHRLSPVPDADPTVMAVALQTLRAALEGSNTVVPPSDARLTTPLGSGPLFVSLWSEGKLVARAEGDGATFGEAIGLAGRRLRAAVEANDRGAGRLKIDRVVARAPVVTSIPLAFALGLDPGLDGLVDADGRLIFLGDDLLRAGAAAAATPFAFLNELRLGIDVAWMNRRIREAGGRAPFARIRTEG